MPACATRYASEKGFWRRIIDTSAPPVTPRLSFILVTEIPLPGPLPEGQPELVEDRVRISVAGGSALTAWTVDAEPELSAVEPTDPDESDVDGWSFDPGGKFRARVEPAGRLVVEKRCGRFCKGWKRAWKLRGAGIAQVPPVLTDHRIYFGEIVAAFKAE